MLVYRDTLTEANCDTDWQQAAGGADESFTFLCCASLARQVRSFVLTRVTQSVLSGCHSMTDVADRAELLCERHVSLNRYMYVSL